MRGLVEDLLTLAGLGLIVAGVATVSGAAAMVVGGALLILLARGSAVDRKFSG